MEWLKRRNAKKASTVIARAAVILGDRGWRSGGGADLVGNKPICALEAVYLASRNVDKPIDYLDIYDDANPAVRYLAKATGYDNPDAISAVYRKNDRAKSDEEIQEWFTKALHMSVERATR